MFEKRILAALSGAAAIGLAGVGAFAANPETVDVEVRFVAPIEINEVDPMRFGLLDVNMAVSDTLVLDTSDGVAPTTPLLNSDQNSANLDVTATAGTAINISVGNHTGSSHYDLSTFTCRYDDEAESACDGPTGLDIDGAEVINDATLRIGATLEITSAPTPGDDFSTFDVTIAYQ